MIRVSVALSLLLFLSLTAGATAAPVAQASKTCSVRGKERSLGASYVTSISARRVTCDGARSIVKAFHACRKRNGGADGRCRGVRGFSCSEDRRRIRSQFSSTATCKKGRKKVTQRYQQFT